MKPIFLLTWLYFAINILVFAPSANAQDVPNPPQPPKKDKRIVIIGSDTIINGNVTKLPGFKDGPQRDSLMKAMNKLSAEMDKLADELGKNTAKVTEKYRVSLEKEMQKLEADMEKLGEEIEKEFKEIEKRNQRTEAEVEVDENFEVEIEEEIETEMEEHASTEEQMGDTSKNKTVTIDDDGIHIRTGKNKRPKNVIKKPRNSATDFLLLDLGLNTFTNNKSFDLPASADPMELRLPKSVNVTLHLFRTGVNIYRHKLYTTFGLAYDMHDYRFTKNITLVPDTGMFAVADEALTLKKNKLSAQYITLPVMIHFESNPMKPSRSFKLGVGGWGGFLANSYTKQITDERGKQHRHDDYNLNQLNYGVRGQIGYGMFTLYSQYALSPLFKKNAGAPELNPITFGVILNGFKWN